MNILCFLTFLGALWNTGPKPEEVVVKEVNRFAQSNYNLKFDYQRMCNLTTPEDMKRGVGYISISYDTKAPFDEMQARKMIVDIVEYYINVLNNSVLKNQLRFLPVTPDHALISINFKSAKGVSVATIASGCKRVTLQTLKEDSFKLLAMETYPETYFKVYGTNPPERK